MQKHVSYNFHIWKKTCHKGFYNLLYVWNCMKLYDKKFLISGNCMIRNFGQPGEGVRAKKTNFTSKFKVFKNVETFQITEFKVCLKKKIDFSHL